MSQRFSSWFSSIKRLFGTDQNQTRRRRRKLGSVERLEERRLLTTLIPSTGGVLEAQRVSDLAGGFTGVLDDDDSFGHNTVSLGDLDGDGVTDVATTSFHDDDGGTDRGAVWVLLLNSDGTVKSHQKISDAGGELGLQDLDHFGITIDALGDLDGDGTTDLAVGTPKQDERPGDIRILFLNPDGSLKGEHPVDISIFDSSYTNSLASIGDFDGDNIPDLLVGTRIDSDGGTDTGAAYVVLLNRDGTVRSHSKISKLQGTPPGFLLDPGTGFGRDVGAIGDLNGDGITELVVSTFNTTSRETSRVYVLFMNGDGTVNSYQTISGTGEGGYVGPQTLLGTGVDGIGDIDGDGVNDLAVESLTASGERYVTVLLLNSDGTVKRHRAIRGLGGRPAPLGDFNGDGILDLLIGDLDNDDGGPNRGAFHVVFLEAAGGQVAQWRAEGDAKDSTGPYHGTLGNGTGFTSGQFGQAFDFDGVDDVITVPNSDVGDLDITGRQLSVEAWVNISAHNQPRNADNVQTIFDKYFDAVGANGYLLDLTNGRPRLVTETSDGSVSVIGDDPIPLNTWVHLLGTYDGEAARIYVNGELQNSESASGRILHSSFNAAIGNDNGLSPNFGLVGAADDVSVHNRAVYAVKAEESTSYAFSAGDFPTTDADGLPLTSVTFRNLNLADGTLTYDGEADVTENTTLTLSELQTLVYEPPANSTGLPLASFDFAINHGGDREMRVYVGSTPAAGSAIRGQKFFDENRNGVRDTGEIGLDGWTIELIDPATNQVVATTTTASRDVNGDSVIDPATERGLYEFSDVTPGDYRVREVVQSDWIQTSPRDLIFDTSGRIAGSDAPTAPTMADLDGDGDVDMVSVDLSTDRVFVFLNDGSGSLTLASTNRVGEAPFALTATDLDGDGDIDVAVAHRDSNDVSVLINDGNAGLSKRQDILLEGRAMAVTAADLDGDGDFDLAVAVDVEAVGEDHISILANDGSGGFARAAVMQTRELPISVVSTDIDNDGDLDLLAAAFTSSEVSVFVNVGDGSGGFSFGKLADVSVGAGPVSVVAVDLNGDGDVDFATANVFSDDVSIVFNDGTGFFTRDGESDVGQVPSSMVATDINLDGHVDLMTVNRVSDDVSILLNDGDGSFTDFGGMNVGDLPVSLATADLDGDGDSDIVTANSADGDYSVIRNLIGEFPITLEEEIIDNINFGNFSPTIRGQKYHDVDFDGERDPGEIGLDGWTIELIDPETDAVIATTTTASRDLNGDGEIVPETEAGLYEFAGLAIGDYRVREVPQPGWVQTSPNDLRFDAVEALEVGGTSLDIVTADLDGDGDIDLITGSSEVSVFLNDGTGSLILHSEIDFGGFLRALITADFDGDGDLDIAVENSTVKGVSVFMNDGNATFTKTMDVGIGSRSESMTAADLDGDGDIDLALARTGSFRVAILSNNGAGEFTPTHNEWVGASPWSVEAADVNGDGHVDLLTANPFEGEIAILLSSGDGEFSEVVGIEVGDFPMSVDATDLDGDGDIDIVTANRNSDSITVLLNAGDGTFLRDADIPVGIGPVFVAATDVNKDGIVDLLTANRSSNDVSVLLNDGNGVLTEFSRLSIQTSNASHLPVAVATVDFDGDGHADLITANANRLHNSILRNLAGEHAISLGAEILNDIDFANVERLQIVSGEDVTVPEGTHVSIPVEYTATDFDFTLNGLGLRMHYDSSLLSLNDLNGVLPAHLIAQQNLADLADYDEDPDTDRYVLFAWSDIDGNWPGPGLPKTLFTVDFNLTAEATEGDVSAINFTASSHSPTHGFRGESINVEVVPATLDIDNNGIADALTDGTLIARYLEGRRGLNLIQGVVAPDAERDTAEEITTYLDQVRELILDADGNGIATTGDGAMIQNYLFGLRGCLMTGHDVEFDASRLTPIDIAAHLDEYHPDPAPAIELNGVSGRVFADENLNGTLDADESAWSYGATLFADLNNNGLLDAGEPAVDHHAGVYCFDFAPGTYTLRTTEPGFTLPGRAREITIDAGEWLSNIDFGFDPALLDIPWSDVIEARPDGATTDENSPITIDVLNNDTPRPPLVVTSVEDPENGTAVDNGDGTITYTPDAGFVGTDIYSYEVGIAPQKVLAGDAELLSEFGSAVDIDGDLAIVGARGDDEIGNIAGAAYIFQFSQGVWSEVAKLTAFDGQAGSRFGTSVAIHGDSAVVGAASHSGAAFATGAAYVFEKDHGGTDNWGFVRKLEHAQPQRNDRFGLKVEIDGNTIVVGTPSDDDPGRTGVDHGSVSVFSRDAGGSDNWGIVKTIYDEGGADDDLFGSSISLDEDTLAVGALGVDDRSGAVFIHRRNQGGADNWGLVRRIDNPMPNNGDAFGVAVSIEGSTLAVGAAFDDVDDPTTPFNGLNAGSVFVFDQNEGGADNWGLTARVSGDGSQDSSNGEQDDNFGIDLSLTGDRLVVGAWRTNGMAGIAYEFLRNDGGNGDWAFEETFEPDDLDANDRFALSIAADGPRTVYGSDRDDDGATNAGAVWFTTRGVDLANVAVVVNPAPNLLTNNSSSQSTTTLNNNTLNGNTTIPQGGWLNGAGGINGNLTNGGLVSPGFSPERITVDGDYVQDSTGELLIELGGRTPVTGFDQLIVSGTVDLDGTLAIELIDGFIPQSGDRFEIITFAGVTGEFHEVTGLDLGDGLSLKLDFAETGLSLVVTEDLADDYPTLPSQLLINGGVAGVQQSGNRIVFTNENGSVSQGRFLDASRVIADDWENGLFGILTGDRIEWENGSFWAAPNISGEYFIYGQPTTIEQTGLTLAFENERGERSTGRLVSETQVIADDWEAGLVGEIVSGRIDWANRTVWSGPDISGGYVTNDGLATNIEQFGKELTFTNESGNLSRGRLLSTTQVIADDWGGLIGNLDGNRIAWENGSVWSTASVAGEYTYNGQTTRVRQFGTGLELTNEQGDITHGRLLKNSSMVANSWEDGLTGRIREGRIEWENETRWEPAYDLLFSDIGSTLSVI